MVGEQDAGREFQSEERNWNHTPQYWPFGWKQYRDVNRERSV